MTKSIAFFHPYCENGGGGERVLWIFIHALLSNSEFEDWNVVIYSGNTTISSTKILEGVKLKFGIAFSKSQEIRIEFITIWSRTLLEAKHYPIATMICQSCAAILVGLECALRKRATVFIDTLGASFMYPIMKLFLIPIVIAYVHYPIISSDMLQKVREQRPSYNNNAHIAKNVAISSLKLYYYLFFAKLYAMVMSFADIVITNSRWTRAHILDICYNKDSSCNNESSVKLIYPPCDVKRYSKIPLERSLHFDDVEVSSEILSSDLRQRLQNKILMISVGQFRPEKDHHLQVSIMEELLKRNNPWMKNFVLLMIGSTRNTEDEQLVHTLESRIHSSEVENLSEHIIFLVNQSHLQLEYFLSRASIGLHTMWNEHFGISVIEMMAAGLIVVAHNSGGPKLDIINSDLYERNGFLASNPDEFADCIENIMSIMSQKENRTAHPMITWSSLQERSRKSSQRFSDEVFSQGVIETLQNAIK